jgi:hypothetical protein
MSISSLNENGFLPHGIYRCTLDEVRQTFARFQETDRRSKLFWKLEQFVAELRAARIISALIINGSFVSGVASPNDIDLLLIVPKGHDFGAELGPTQYRVFDRQRVRKTYGLDIFVVEEDSPESEAFIQFFQRVRLKPELTKGILKIDL